VSQAAIVLGSRQHVITSLGGAPWVARLRGWRKLSAWSAGRVGDGDVELHLRSVRVEPGDEHSSGSNMTLMSSPIGQYPEQAERQRRD